MKLFLLRIALVLLFPFCVLIILSEPTEEFGKWLREFKDLWRGRTDDDHTDGIEL